LVNPRLKGLLVTVAICVGLMLLARALGYNIWVI
jgi:hypothetical protein